MNGLRTLTPHDGTIVAPDGRALAASTYPGTAGDIVVIPGARGVPRGFYTVVRS